MGIDVEALLINIRLAYQHMNESKPDSSLLSKLKLSTKSNSNATAARNLGNVMFINGDDAAALLLYNESISSAVDNSVELSLAYGNRSAVLYRLRKYELCLLDVNRALKIELGSDARKKLQHRRKKCAAKVRAKKKRFESEDPTNITEFSDDLKNSLHSSTLCKIKLAYNEKWGRHVVAAENIEPGEILSYEEFFSTLLNSDRLYSNCSHCFVKCDTLTPCPSCSKVMYCSDQCRNQAYQSYHRTECKMWPFYEDERLDDYDITSIRTLLIGTEQGAKLKVLAKNSDAVRIFDEEKKKAVDEPFKSNYLSILGLRRTFREPSKDTILLAVKVVCTLRGMSLFGTDSEDNGICRKTKNNVSDGELFAILALINHLDTIKFYRTAVSEVIKNETDSSHHERVLGFGVGALHNLVNHSCDPNVGDFVLKREHAFYALRPIQKGQQIFTSYCAPFAKNHLSRRRNELSFFEITCRCKACTYDWPTDKGLRQFDIMTGNRTTREIAKDITILADQGELDKIETFEIAVKYRKIIQNHVRSPCFLIVKCEELIRNFMRRKYGNAYVEDVEQMKNDMNTDELIDRTLGKGRSAFTDKN